MNRHPSIFVVMYGLLACVNVQSQRFHGGLTSHWALPVAHDPSRPGVSNCSERYFEQPIDHFAYHPENNLEGLTFQQRYFVCGELWWGGLGAPIFFYTGNEADVTLYLNASGLMWENAPEFGALLVFAEHRYYGKSQPLQPFTAHKMDYLSSEQALADYARLIIALKTELNSPDSPVIAFGGSYGGMLASWWRLLYPHLVSGAIAGSAPVLDFEPEVGKEGIESFSYIVTRDASPEGGSNAYCADNVRAAWPVIKDLAASVTGRQELTERFRICQGALATAEDVDLLFGWLQSAWAYMAMGNYPFPSTYVLNGRGTLPAWPVRVACESLNFPTTLSSNATLLEGLRNAVSVYYNYSRPDGEAPIQCFDLAAGVNKESQMVEDHWTYQFCTEMFMPSGSDGIRDDPEEVKEVRKTELAHIARWVMEAGEATEWANEKRKVKDVRKMLRTV
ncbi:hypothetical protein NSK_001543 [Nannochloropsis salina CCMP1776]|uniref:Lysosomal Pro-X carboxypeptidase n=1 Tax=Nannochloropsis salina CCMP1776 TaxID=1027361 RepID=A0A4D9D674_9STRA|nr:hypothetical protein NSK_001543 [Nannochloropsis salina CCMP1776]|eukprot:TFJ87211.1 hypothetical protein NSK_001543 [Nannochloropsis salina CCMP1776]